VAGEVDCKPHRGNDLIEVPIPGELDVERIAGREYEVTSRPGSARVVVAERLRFVRCEVECSCRGEIVREPEVAEAQRAAERRRPGIALDSAW
jgi:hypothetical protein